MGQLSAGSFNVK